MSDVPREPADERGSYNYGSAVYGLITVSALLVAESAAKETYGETVLGVLIALLLYWMAHAYSEFVSWRAEGWVQLNRAGIRRMLRRELPILVGAVPPILAVLIAWPAGASLSSAITIAAWTAAATILVAEVIAGLQAELSGRELVLQALVGTGLGVLILVLKLVLH
jgi:hypothetical protein